MTGRGYKRGGHKVNRTNREKSAREVNALDVSLCSHPRSNYYFALGPSLTSSW